MNVSSSPWSIGTNLANYYGQSNIITPEAGESIYLPSAISTLPNDHGLPSDIFSTGYYSGTDRDYVSDASPQATTESTVPDEFLAHNGTYFRPLVGYSTVDEINTTYHYIYFNGTTYSNQQIALPSFAARENTTIFNFNTFKNSGTIDWNETASSYTSLADVSAPLGNYGARQWGLVIDNELIDTQSSATALATKLEELRAAARASEGSFNFSYVYIDEILLNGNLFQVVSDAYQWNYRSERYDPNAIITKIGAYGLLNINFDNPSKYLDTLTDLTTLQSAQYEEIDPVVLSGIKGNIFDKNGKKLTENQMGNAMATGTGFDVYGTARVKNITATGSNAGTFTNNIDYVVYNQALFNKMTGGFVPNYNYNNAIRDGSISSKTQNWRDADQGNIHKKTGSVLEETDAYKLASEKTPTDGRKGLYYDNSIDSWKPFISASATYPLGTAVTGGITKTSHEYYMGTIANISVNKGEYEQDQFTNADLKLFSVWRPIVNQKWIFSAGYAVEGSYSKNPFGENAYNITHGINIHNRFNVLDDISFYFGLGSVNATGLNKYSDVKDSVMQTWNGKIGTKYRLNSQWAFDLSASYSRLNIYYDNTTLNMFNPGIVAEDNYVDKAGAEFSITNYSADAQKATSLRANVSRSIHNSKDNTEDTEAKITLEHTNENYTYSAWVSTINKEGTFDSNKRETSAGGSVTIRFN